jgi:8-oxo-dGTP diphosphatase
MGAVREKAMPIHYTIVAALIRRNDGILLVRQQGTDDPEPKWALPGGVAEPGELLHEALAREIREETSLEMVRSGVLIYVAQTHITFGLLRGYADATPEEYIATAFIFEIAEWRGEPPEHLADPDGFVSEVRFFPEGQAITLLDQLSFRPMREPIIAYLRGEVTSGALWLYRRDARDADATLVLRMP